MNVSDTRVCSRKDSIGFMVASARLLVDDVWQVTVRRIRGERSKSSTTMSQDLSQSVVLLKHISFYYYDRRSHTSKEPPC